MKRKILCLMLLFSVFGTVQALPDSCSEWTTEEGCEVLGINKAGGGWQLWIDCPDGYSGYDDSPTGTINFPGQVFWCNT